MCRNTHLLLDVVCLQWQLCGHCEVAVTDAVGLGGASVGRCGFGWRVRCLALCAVAAVQVDLQHDASSDPQLASCHWHSS